MSRGCAPGRRGKGMWVKLRGPLVRQVLPVVDPFLRVPRNTELRGMSYAWQLLWISRNDVCVAVALFSFEFRIFQYSWREFLVHQIHEAVFLKGMADALGIRCAFDCAQ